MGKLVPINMNPDLWERFDKVVFKLKELGILEESESRSSLIKTFIKAFVVENEKQLKKRK